MLSVTMEALRRVPQLLVKISLFQGAQSISSDYLAPISGCCIVSTQILIRTGKIITLILIICSLSLHLQTVLLDNRQLDHKYVTRHTLYLT